MNSGLRKLGSYLISAALWCWGAGNSVFAEEGVFKETRSFTTNRSHPEHYDNDAHLQETLEFLGADCVEIKIVGSSDKADVLKVYVAHQESMSFSGKVNTVLSVFDNKIGVEFRSNSYATDKGFQVTLLEKGIDRCLPEIRQEFINAAQNMLHYGANEISNNVETSQSQLSNVHSSLRQNNNLENILPEVIKSFLELAAYYQKVSDNASQIKTTLENHQQALEKLQQRVADIIERLGKGQAEYSSIAERDQLLESHTELQQLKKKRLISADAYQKLAANVATRKKVWERLHQLQYEVIKPLPLYVENIQVLLHFMVSNAQVYQQAASETVLRNERLTGFTTNLDSLKQAVTIITQQEEILRTALENLGQKYEVTDKPR